MPSMTKRTTGASQQNWLVNVTVDGRPLGIFDSHSGGDNSADVTKHRPGGMRPERAYPALPSYDDVTVARAYELERDGELVAWLHTRVGLATMTVSVSLLDPLTGVVSTNRRARRTFTGLLSGITTPESDSNASDVSTYELTMVTESIS